MRGPMDRMRLAEGRRRLRIITYARTAALLVIAAIVSAVSPPETWPYYYGLIAIFIALGWATFAVNRSRFDGPWRDYAFVAADFALITFTVLVPAPDAPPELPAAFYLRFDNFDYLYVILGGLAISLRPMLLIWGGICGAAFWSVGLWWLSLDERVSFGPISETDDRATALRRMWSDPNNVDLGFEFQGIAIFLIVAVLLAVAVEASHRLFLREAANERRAANLSRYLPAEMIESLANRDTPFDEKIEVEAAILFADIVGFSRLAERHAPHEVIALLREAHRIVETQVFAHGGMLDKFIGDGAMAVFGAARRDAAGEAPDAARAIRCAGAILTEIARWSAARGGEPVLVSVGVHWGHIILGDVGSERRMELAVIGDAVNVASRLESMTRELGVGAAVSEAAMAAGGWPGGLNRIGPRAVPGRDDAVVVWAIPRAEPRDEPAGA